MKHSYWISYQFQMPDGRSGFGAMDIFTEGGPIVPGMIPLVTEKIRQASGLSGANVVILAISKFEQS